MFIWSYTQKQNQIKYLPTTSSSGWKNVTFGPTKKNRCYVICLENDFKCIRHHANLEEQHQQSLFLLGYVPSPASGPQKAEKIFLLIVSLFILMWTLGRAKHSSQEYQAYLYTMKKSITLKSTGFSAQLFTWTLTSWLPMLLGTFCNKWKRSHKLKTGKCPKDKRLFLISWGIDGYVHACKKN